MRGRRRTCRNSLHASFIALVTRRPTQPRYVVFRSINPVDTTGPVIARLLARTYTTHGCPPLPALRQPPPASAAPPGPALTERAPREPHTHIHLASRSPSHDKYPACRRWHQWHPRARVRGASGSHACPRHDKQDVPARRLPIKPSAPHAHRLHSAHRARKSHTHSSVANNQTLPPGRQMYTGLVDTAARCPCACCPHDTIGRQVARTVWEREREREIARTLGDREEKRREKERKEERERE